MLFNCVVIIAKKQTAYCNPFRPVETRLNLSKHVSIRSDLSRPVSRLPPLPSSIPPSPPSSPFSPFFWGGGRGEGEGGRGREGGKPPPPKPPGRGGDEVPPLPHRILNTNPKKQNSLTLSSLCCVIYPSYPPKGFSLSPLLLLLLLKTT